MKKYALGILVFLGLLSVQQESNAQTNQRSLLSGGIKVNQALPDFSKSNKFGVGFDLQYEYYFSSKVSLVLNTGISFFLGRNSSNGTFDGKTVGYIPFLGGVRVYPVSGLFIGAQAGYGLYQDGFLKGPNAGGFTISPQIGWDGPGAQIYFFYSYTNVGNSYMNVGNLQNAQISHIGGSIIFKGVTSFLF